MMGREGVPNRQQPKSNSLRIQSPLSKMFLIREVVQYQNILIVVLRFGPHGLTITYYPPKVMV
jgi:hypothetical protein